MDDYPALPELSPGATLALLARMLHREGYDDHVAGHLTWLQPDGTILSTPRFMAWNELRPQDIMRVDRDGDVVDGPWSVTIAIEVHLAAYRARPDLRCVVHNHPRYATLWAGMHQIPPAYDQTSAIGLHADDIVLHDEYSHVADGRAARLAGQAFGDQAWVVLLANHGVLVGGEDLVHAHARCVALEWRSRNAWMHEATAAGMTLKPDVAAELGRFDLYGNGGLFAAMARQELRADPSFLDG